MGKYKKYKGWCVPADIKFNIPIDNDFFSGCCSRGYLSFTCRVVLCDECLFTDNVQNKDIIIEYLVEHNHITKGKALQLSLDLNNSN